VVVMAAQCQVGMKVIIVMEWEGGSGRRMVEGRREFVVRRACWSIDRGLLYLDA